MTNGPTSEAATALASHLGGESPRAAIILGSGWGGLTAHMEQPRTVSFEHIPHFASSTAEGHRGAFVSGLFGSSRTPLVAMSGRLHCYEGWSLSQVTFPVAVLATLGVKVLIVTNAAGGLHPNLEVGDVMILRDHINWIHLPRRQGQSARTSDGSDSLLALGRGSSTRTGDCHSPYDPALAAAAGDAARRADIAVHQGTYLATLGPNYETRAEYRMMRRIGADAVGMSTTPEVLMARQLGVRVLALSMISNVAFPKTPQQNDHQHVLEAGRRSEPKLRTLIEGVLSALA